MMTLKEIRKHFEWDYEQVSHISIMYYDDEIQIDVWTADDNLLIASYEPEEKGKAMRKAQTIAKEMEVPIKQIYDC